MHRVGAGTDDGTGWFFAKSTLGGFSVSLPGAFNDYTVRVQDANIGLVVTNIVGFKTSDGFEVLVSLFNGTEKSNPIDLNKFAPMLKSKFSGSEVVSRERAAIDGLPAINVTMTGTEQNSYISYLVEGKSFYTVSVACPVANAEQCSEIHAKIIATFKRSAK